MKKISIAVVDGNFLQRNNTLMLVDEYLARTHLGARVDWFNSGPGVLESIHKNGRYDIYIIDPMLPGYEGMRLANEIRRLGDRGHLIFISENTKFAFSSYEVKALDYISKPINRNRLFATLDSAIQSILENSTITFVELSLKNGYKRVPVDNISYVDIVDRALCYHMKDGHKFMSKCLRVPFEMAVEEISIEPWFEFAGKTRLVNIEHIVVLNENTAIMRSGEKVAITYHAYPRIYKLWHESLL